MSAEKAREGLESSCGSAATEDDLAEPSRQGDETTGNVDNDFPIAEKEHEGKGEPNNEQTTTAGSGHEEIEGNANSSADSPNGEMNLDQRQTDGEKDDIFKSEDQSLHDKQPSIERESQTIYLNDNKPAVKAPASKTPKRLTRAEKAALESLAAFGGSDFGSLSVRKVDLQDQLKTEAEIRKKNEKEGNDQNGTTPKPQRRLQKAREEVEQQFKDIAFGEGMKKYPKVAMAKQKAILEKGAADRKVAVKYRTRLQKAKEYSTGAFGGESLGSLAVKNKEKMKSAHLKKTKVSDNAKGKPEPASSLGRNLKRTDQAKLETIQTFGGDNLDKVLGNSRKRVARHFDAYPAKKAKVSGDADDTDENEDTVDAVEKENSDIEVPSAQ